MGGLAGSALVGAAVLLAVPGGAAGAATLPQLPISGLTQVLADGVHNHLFLSSNGSIVVTNLAGKLVTTLDAGDGAAGMALAPDGGTLYVALGGTNAVAAISTTSLKQTALYQLGTAGSPASIAVQNGRLWVSYTAAAPGIGYFKLGTAAFVPAALTGPAWTTAPRLAADPLDEGVLVAIDHVAAPTMIASYNVSGATPVLTPLAQNAAFAACGQFSDIAVTPGGAQVVLACGAGATDLRFATATLAAAGSYASGATPDAVAIALDGSVAAGTGDATGPQLKAFKAGAAAPVNSFQFAAAGEVVAADGLSWTSDATKLFAVLEDPATTTYYLDALEYPQFKASTLDLTSTGSGTFPAGGKVVLHGKLELGGAPAPAGVLMKVFRQVVGSSAITTLVAHTVAGGTYTLTDTPPHYGHFYYTAYYPTTGTYAPNWHSTLVIVTALHTTLRLTPASTSVTSGTTVQVTARLGKTHNSRVVSFYAQPAGGTKKLIKSGKVNGQGILTISYKVTKNTTFTAVFTGDAYYAPATATATVKA